MSEPIDFAQFFTEKQRGESAGTLMLADIDALIDQVVSAAAADPVFLISGKKCHVLLRFRAKGKRYARWQQIRKRQRRAAQRRHERGKA